MLRAAIVGVSGYTGAELLRLLLGHPNVELGPLFGHGKAGLPLAKVLPSFAGVLDRTVESFDATRAGEADVAFLALPHGAAAEIARALVRKTRVLDLSADFRLRDVDEHARWYGPHHAPELAARAVYGLPELFRESIAKADLVAVPGCYPTASALAVAPLLRAGLVEADGIVIDAKSGVSGAGRTPKESTHLPEAAEGIRAYSIAGTHRHTPEIEQTLSMVAGRPIRVLFTPHLVPMTRGILATAYAVARDNIGAEHCTAAARALYDGSPSVVVLDPGATPDTLWARGSNRAFVSYALDPRTNRVIAQCAIDNLVKGAAGQAIQCMNVRFGLDEGAGLRATAAWP